MRAHDILAAKRDGAILSEEQIRWILDAYTAGVVPDYQMAALLMAIFIHGLNAAELSVWTDAMIRSGRVMDLSSVPGVKVDKHSTGGVGDKVSLPLAPLVAECGVPVPMISGRGLGHTGGTLDKLESIPGFSVDLDPQAYADTVRDIGLCLIGQTDDLCPADRKLYALRDVTATVASVPLIASSIMSKKLAEGIDALVLDVKVGTGAFMKTLDRARLMAETMVAIGEKMGRRTVAYITDMNQPLGRRVGNALEVREAIEVLDGGGPQDLVEVTLALGAEMLVLGGVAADLPAAREKLEAARREGRGLARFARLIEAQGGDPSVLEHPERLPDAARRLVVTAPRSGYVQAIATEELGVAALILGAGRETKEDVIDPAVGMYIDAKLGVEVREGDALVTLHFNSYARLEDSARRALAAYTIGDEPPPAHRLIVERISA